MNKKHIFGAAMLIMAMVFSGCGNKNQKQEQEEVKPEEETTAEVKQVKRLLIIVDPQVDFTTGSLAVNGGCEAMDNLIEAFQNGLARNYDRIFVTQDCHPANHCSFVEQGGDFPPHCVRDTKGSKIYPDLQDELEHVNGIEVEYLTKGDRADVEEFSILKNQKSCEHIKEMIKAEEYAGIDICGIASDYCVYETLKDLIEFYPAEKIRVATNCVAAVADNELLPNFMTEKGVETIEF